MAKETVSPKTMDEFQALVAKQESIPSEVEIDTGAPDDITFEDGPLAGTKMKASDLNREETSTGKETPPVTKPAEVNKDAQPNPANAAPGDQVPAPGEQTPPAAAGDEKPVSANPEATAVETPAPYQANTGYKVYDQEKQFPDWAKPLATSKETEDNLRTTLSKSDAFDVLKPKHESTVRERDEAKSHVQEHVSKTQRLIELRDKDPALFYQKVGVDPEALMLYAGKLAQLQRDDPAAYARYLADTAARATADERAEQENLSRATQATGFQAMHQQAVDMTFAQPDVAAFKARMDSTLGNGAFERAFRTYGSQVMQTEGRYLQPIETARWVMEKWAQSLPPGSPASAAAPVVAAPAPGQVTPPAPQANVLPVTPPAQAAPPPRVKNLPPNLGRGTSASPVKQRPKSFAELEKMVESGG